MKRKILAALILAGFLLASTPALAVDINPASNVSTQADRQLKAKLLKLSRKQAITGYKITRNIGKAKTNIKRVKKARAWEKKRRTKILGK